MKVIRLYCRESDEGAECLFFKIPGRKMGIKAYFVADEARRAYDLQKKGYKMGIAPAVGQMYIIINERRKNELLLGYETEIAKYPSRKVWDEQRQSLFTKLQKIGLGGDLRPDNCGQIGNRLVLVDFGICSRNYKNAAKDVSAWRPKSC
jgi:hypothetical protein